MIRIIPLAALSLLVAAPAWAQSTFSPNYTAKAPQAAPAGPAPQPPPPALPGSRAEKTAVAPAAKNVMDLPPTEALFDAINRGDLPAAKDAVNRGADLSGHNVLGLTPLEQSVDLGRNEISFLLLSLRGTSSAAAGPTTAKPTASDSRADRLAAAKAERAERTGRSRAAAAVDAPPAAPRTARLFAGDGGAPAPQAGFLGFDSVR